MKKSVKAFTLVELIVSIACLGIIMAGVVSMFQPISSVYSNTSVISSQRAAEYGIANYIACNVRYAQSIGIYEDVATPEAAVTAFLNQHPTKLFDGPDADEDADPLTEADLDVICIVNNTPYKTDANSQNFYGRIVRRMDGKTACSLDQSNFDYTGTTGNSYMAMGAAYYGNADYYIRITNLTDTGFDITVDSDYYFSRAKKTNDYFQRNDTSSNYTKVSVRLENPTIPATASTTTVKRVVDNHLVADTGSRINRIEPDKKDIRNTYIVYYTVK